MKIGKISAAAAGALFALAAASPLNAHHSSSMFNLLAPIWVEGRFVEFERVNPHTIMLLEEMMADGRLRRWSIEGPDVRRLDRMGIPQDFLEPGDEIGFCAFALREGLKVELDLPQDSTYAREQFVHGHLLVMPDESRMIWGSYGNLGGCIESSDEPVETWIDFLNTGARSLEFWCRQRSFAMRSPQSTEAFKAYIEELNARIEFPCD